ncbi:MAG: hypothetical protein WA621_21385 [Candidatus Acidiferrum sp.]
MDPIAVRDQIDRILRSQNFASKGQLKKLLEILFKYMDSQTKLKPDLVIQELWPEETRTKRAADVATEMNRLRNALESYYSGEGQNDSITIFLPNRSASSADGTQMKRWIAAMPRGGSEERAPGDHPAGPQANRRRMLKILAPIAAFAIVAYISIRILAGHGQPQSGRLDGTTLTILDADGKGLWSKSFPDGFWPSYYEHGIAERIWFVDFGGKGHTSVLFLYHPAVRPWSFSTTLICYSDRGKEKWRWTSGKVLPELEGNPATFEVAGLGILNATTKTPPRIVVSSFHNPMYPDQVAIVDANGKTLSEYWHSGHLQHLTVADLDGDGKQEIVATGISNGYHEATLVVLDSDRVFGASIEAARPEIQIHGMGAAQERLRLLFPRSDMNKTLSVYNDGEEPTIESGRIRFSVQECSQFPACIIWYEFDRNFNLVSVLADDGFRSAHAQFYLNGKNAHPFTKVEEAEFQKVRCLVGCKTEFVPNDIH